MPPTGPWPPPNQFTPPTQFTPQSPNHAPPRPWGPPQAAAPTHHRLAGRGRTPGRIVAVAGLVIALVVSIVLTAETRPPTAMPAVAAGDYLGPSGHREFLQSPDGSQRLIETSHLPGLVGFLDAPTAFQNVLGIFGSETSGSTYWVTETMEDGADFVQELYSVAGDGLMLHAYQRNDEEFLIEPGLVELPFDATPGESWTSIATVIAADGTQTEVRRTGRVSGSAQPGCLDIQLDDAYPDQSDSTVITRCPGRGLVAVDEWSAVGPFDRDAAGLDLRPPVAVAPTGNPTTLPLFAGETAISVGQTTAPVALGDGILLANRATGQLNFAAPGPDGTWPLQWRRRAGDAVVTMLGAGELAVVATNERRLVAYDQAGRWRWQAETEDLVAHLIRLDELRFVAVDLAGRLSVRSLADGTELWSAQVVAGARQAPVVVPTPTGPGVAVVGGRRLSLVSAEGHVQNVSLRSDAETLAVVGPSVLVSDADAGLSAFNWDATPLRRGGTPDLCRDLAALGELLVCATSTELIAVSHAGERVQWRQPISALGIEVVGDQLMATGRQTTWLVDAVGTIVGDWPVERSSPTHWVVALRSGLLVMGSDSDSDWWAKR